MTRFMTKKECKREVSRRIFLYFFCTILFHRFNNVSLEIHYCKRTRANIDHDIDKHANYISSLFLWHDSLVSNTDYFIINNYSDAIRTYRKLIGKEVSK